MEPHLPWMKHRHVAADDVFLNENNFIQFLLLQQDTKPKHGQVQESAERSREKETLVG